MHTVKDVIEHYFNLIIEKDDSTKMIAVEADLNRFGHSTDSINEQSNYKPYQISKDQKKIADARAVSIICPFHVDFKPCKFFSKTNFNSHDWKQVCLYDIILLL